MKKKWKWKKRQSNENWLDDGRGKKVDLGVE
jgi:hypothetical protein